MAADRKRQSSEKRARSPEAGHLDHGWDLRPRLPKLPIRHHRHHYYLLGLDVFCPKPAMGSLAEGCRGLLWLFSADLSCHPRALCGEVSFLHTLQGRTVDAYIEGFHDYRARLQFILLQLDLWCLHLRNEDEEVRAFSSNEEKGFDRPQACLLLHLHPYYRVSYFPFLLLFLVSISLRHDLLQAHNYPQYVSALPFIALIAGHDVRRGYTMVKHLSFDAEMKLDMNALRLSYARKS
ncbi:hypothetical protein COCNU_scaffold005105G000010 [Cocos nucifera]|nr:hypothetical protein [Cocos nucifera]